MNAQEAATLCRAARSVCPQQKFDEFTPDFWHPLLADIGFEDAKHALIEVAKRQPFVSPAEIRNQVALTNRARKRELPPVVPPRELADDPRVESQWIKAWGDAFIAGHTEQRAREIACNQIGIVEDTASLALEAGSLRDELDRAERARLDGVRMAQIQAEVERRARAERREQQAHEEAAARTPEQNINVHPTEETA